MVNFQASISPGGTQLVQAVWAPVGFQGTTSWTVTNDVNSSVQFTTNTTSTTCSIQVSENSPGGYLVIIAKEDCGGSPGACGELRQRVKVGCGECGTCDSGYKADAGLDSVSIRFPLGLISQGRSAGNLDLRASVPHADLATPGGLNATIFGNNEVSVVYDSNGLLRQVKSGDTLVNIVTNSVFSYRLNYYPQSQIGAYTGGLWAFTGNPVRVWQVSNPNNTTANLNTLLLTRDPDTDASSSRYDHDSGEWTLTTGITASNANGLARETVSNSVAGALRTETRTIEEPNSTLRSKTVTTYRTFTVAGQPVERVVSVVQDPDGDKLTTFHAYDAQARLILTAETSGATSGTPTGNWTRWSYDANGRISTVYQPYGNGATNLTGNLRFTTNSYAVISGSGDDNLANYAHHPRTVTESVILGGASTEISKTYHVYKSDGAGGRMEIEEKAAAPGFGYENTNNHRTVSYYHPDAFTGITAGKLRQRIGSDGLAVSKVYQPGNLSTNALPWSFTYNANGTYLREITIHGTATATNGVTHRTTWDIQVTDALGRAWLEESYLYTGALNPQNDPGNRLSWSAYTLDSQGRVTETHKSDGTVQTDSYDCCGLSSRTAEDGRVTTFTYDALQRRKTEVQLDFPNPGTHTTTTNTYDAVGRVLSTTVSAGSLSNTRSTGYDLVGRVVLSTDEHDRDTVTDYSVDSLTQTVTTPLGAVWVTKYNQDGSVSESPVAGSDVREYHSYLVDASVPGPVHKVVTGTTSTAPMWRKSYVNYLGQSFREDRNAPAGYDMRRQSTFDSRGRVTAELHYRTNAGGSSWSLLAGLRRYHTHDDLGEVVFSGIDYDQSGTLVEASNDRITKQEVLHVFLDSAWWLERKSYFYPTYGSSTKVLESTQRTRLTGLGVGNLVAEEVSLDRYNNPTTHKTLLYPSLKKRVVITDVPTSDTNAEETTTHGMPRTSRDVYGLVTTHTYDSLGRRLTSGDPRAGTNTWTYSEAGLMETHVDVFGKTTEYEYDDDAQLVLITDPLGKEKRFNYDLHGRASNTWGTATYPTWVEYDGFGRTYKMHTYRTDSGFSGATWPAGAGSGDVTTWSYDSATGLLTSKTDAANKAVSYAYDHFGRLSTRTWARAKAGGGSLVTTYYYLITGEQYYTDYNDGTPFVGYNYHRDGVVSAVTDELGVRVFERIAPYYDVYRESFNPGGGGLYPGLYVQSDRQPTNSATSVIGRFKGLSTNTGLMHYMTYDTKGRIATKSSASGWLNHSFGYLADTPLVNTVTSRDFSSTRLTRTTSYGPVGYRITNVVNAAANGTLTYAYPDFDDAGRRLKMTRGDTTSTALDHNAYWAYTYNDKGELASGKKKDASNNAFPGLNNEYTYDSIGNRTEWKTGGDTSGANLRSIPYTANNLNQYTSIDSASSPDYDVTGDAVAAGTVTVDGNATGRRGAWFHREIATNNNSVAVYATNLVRVVNAGVTNSTNVVTFVAQDPEAPLYDDDGNLTRDGRWVYTWTGENRLRRMETRTDLPAAVPRINLEFKYDHLGRRIMKQVKEGATVLETRYYVWHGWQLIWELNETFGFRKAFEWGPDVSHTLEGAGTVGGLLHVMDLSGAWESWVSYPCYDGNGNVMGLVGYAYGNILCKYEYDPYGRLIRTSGNTALAASNPFLFSTKFLDRETGLSYYGYRYYSAEEGRWLNRDPIGEAGGYNLYQFNSNNSISKIDLVGHQPWDVILTTEEKTLMPGFGKDELHAGETSVAKWDPIVKSVECGSGKHILPKKFKCCIFEVSRSYAELNVWYDPRIGPADKFGNTPLKHELKHVEIYSRSWRNVEVDLTRLATDRCEPCDIVQKKIILAGRIAAYHRLVALDGNFQYDNVAYVLSKERVELWDLIIDKRRKVYDEIADYARRNRIAVTISDAPIGAKQ